MITRPPFESELQSRMALGQERLQQEYAKSQQLIDLLALQKLSKEKAEAARAIQASMQTNPASVKDQLEQQLVSSNKQGIASMMPGVQVQGQRMAQAQARKAAGIPSQPAPNMARMAGGGIVAFQEGGSISNELISRLNKSTPKGKIYVRTMGLDADGNEIEGLTLVDAPMYSAYPEKDRKYLAPPEMLSGPPEMFRGVAYEPPPSDGQFEEAFAKARAEGEDTFMWRGKPYHTKYAEEMASGGVVGFQEGGLLSEEELRRVEETIANRPTNTPPSYMTPAERRAQREAETAASRERNAEMQRRRQELMDMGLTIPEVNAFMERGEQAATQTPKMSDEKLESILSMMEDPNDYSPQEVPTRETLNRYEEGEGDASTVMGQTSVDDILAEMESISTPADQSTDPSVDVRGLTNLITDYGEGVLDPGYAESQRSARQGEAQKAYAVPEELRQLYEERQTELESLKRTPEDIRNRELAALLGGLASSPYIARSGTQAYRGMQKVGDEARQENIATAEKSFGMAKELANLDRTASISAFKEGLTALSEANSAQMVGLQTVNNMIQGVQNRELQGKLSQQSNRLQTLQAQFQNELKKIDVAADIDKTRQTNIRALYDSIDSLRSDLTLAKTEMEAMFGSDPETKARIDSIYTIQINAANDTANSLASLLNLGTGTASGAPTTSTLSEADSIVGVE